MLTVFAILGFAALLSGGAAGNPADFEEFERALHVVKKEEGGGRDPWMGWNAADGKAGVSFGVIQFNQKVGSLPALLKRMYNADVDKFEEIFGDWTASTQNEEWVRSANLNHPDFKRRLIATASHQAFRDAQTLQAKVEYWDPAVSELINVGKNTSWEQRVMAFRCRVQFSPGTFETILSHVTTWHTWPAAVAKEKPYHVRTYASTVKRLQGGR